MHEAPARLLRSYQVRMRIYVADGDSRRELQRRRKELRQSKTRCPVNLSAERPRENPVGSLCRVILIDDRNSDRAVVLLVVHANASAQAETENLEGRIETQGADA